MNPRQFFEDDERLTDILWIWTSGEKCFPCPPDVPTTEDEA